MQYVRLGKTGLKVSRICLGCMGYGNPTGRKWMLDEATSRPFFQRALEMGINFFDTAEGATVRAREDGYAHRLYRDPGDWDVVDRVAEVAKRREVKPAQVALAWLLHQPGVTAPIVGATRMEHLEDAVKALDLQLSEDERKELEELYKPHPVLGHG